MSVSPYLGKFVILLEPNGDYYPGILQVHGQFFRIGNIGFMEKNVKEIREISASPDVNQARAVFVM